MATTPHKNSNMQIANTSDINLHNASQFCCVRVGLTCEAKILDTIAITAMMLVHAGIAPKLHQSKKDASRPK